MNEARSAGVATVEARQASGSGCCPTRRASSSATWSARWSAMRLGAEDFGGRRSVAGQSLEKAASKAAVGGVIALSRLM
ncbi:hypothetical protein ACIBH1_17365 [Nonomuraea sp. NPDC050663]|uniref:hypothetical protein n=1 Tax=Nonomuraea sp. NPDC050663 TaxID=3364370 RepID=UPI0037916E48